MNREIDLIPQQRLFYLLNKDSLSTDRLHRRIEKAVAAGFYDECFDFTSKILLLQPLLHPDRLGQSQRAPARTNTNHFHIRYILPFGYNCFLPTLRGEED